MNGSRDQRALSPELLEDARWAPSPHNVQPRLVRCRDDGAADLVLQYNPIDFYAETTPPASSS